MWMTQKSPKIFAWEKDFLAEKCSSRVFDVKNMFTTLLMSWEIIFMLNNFTCYIYLF